MAGALARFRLGDDRFVARILEPAAARFELTLPPPPRSFPIADVRQLHGRAAVGRRRRRAVSELPRRDGRRRAARGRRADPAAADRLAAGHAPADGAAAARLRRRRAGAAGHPARPLARPPPGPAARLPAARPERGCPEPAGLAVRFPKSKAVSWPGHTDDDAIMAELPASRRWRRSLDRRCAQPVVLLTLTVRSRSGCWPRRSMSRRSRRSPGRSTPRSPGCNSPLSATCWRLRSACWCSGRCPIGTGGGGRYLRARLERPRQPRLRR